jgi:hypothetical protein
MRAMLHLAVAAAQLHAGGAAFVNCTPAAAGPAAQACLAMGGKVNK